MDNLGSSYVYGYNGEQLQVNWHRSGKTYFIEVQIKDGSTGHNKGDPMVVELRPGEHRQVSHQYEERRAESLAERLDTLFRFKRDRTGLLVPDIEDATVIVDRNGAGAFSALNGATGQVDEVQKAAVEVKGPVCTCPMRALMSVGCKCGALK